MLKKILYVSNIEVPYRNEYFNQLSQKVDLTVLYERKKSSNRDKKWSSSVKSVYKKEFLKGIKIKNENVFDIRILKYVFSKKYDEVIIGCFNSPTQVIAIIFMKLFRKKYILNLDGEYFLEGKGLKQKIKRFIIRGAYKYLVAGEKTKQRLSKFIKKEKIYSYHFSSLTKSEVLKNGKSKNKNINNSVLVVGQFLEYKGLDIALEIAKNDSERQYIFIGSGTRSNLLKKEIENKNIKNVELIPFLEKKLLFEEYKKCLCLLLTSRKECWGLVINEAASFGCPIISTVNSGAALEFLNNDYENYLVNNDDINNYVYLIQSLSDKDLDDYRLYLLKKSLKYNIDDTVTDTLKMLEEIESNEN